MLVMKVHHRCCPRWNQLWELFNLLQREGRYSTTGEQSAGSSLAASSAKSTEEMLLSLIAESEQLGAGEDYLLAEWHRRELAKLTMEIQSELHSLQHPKDCTKARILICEALTKWCGFGCEIHAAIYCLFVALVSNRTMLFADDGAHWRYSSEGWTTAFLPITSCTAESSALNGTTTVGTTTEWSGITQRARVVRLTNGGIFKIKSKQTPLSLSVELRNRLVTHHSNYIIFLSGQLLHYLMKENEEVTKHIEVLAAKIPFDEGPIVGLHIRRTDKVGDEAEYYSVEEYMRWTDYWYRIQEIRTSSKVISSSSNNSSVNGSRNRAIKRRVFVATDDPTVIDELRSKYNDHYEFFSNAKGPQTAQVEQRYSQASVLNLLGDIRLLSRCTYLVCTFTSMMGRTAYELMQVEQGDRAEAAHSLDAPNFDGKEISGKLSQTSRKKAVAAANLTPLSRFPIVEPTKT